MSDEIDVEEDGILAQIESEFEDFAENTQSSE